MLKSSRASLTSLLNFYNLFSTYFGVLKAQYFTLGGVIVVRTPVFLGVSTRCAKSLFALALNAKQAHLFFARKALVFRRHFYSSLSLMKKNQF